MTTQTPTQLSSYEQKITAIVRRLPPERQLHLLAYARFLAFETFETVDLDFLEDESDTGTTYTEGDARWDALLASEEGQLALDRLADQALAEIRDGKANSMVFTVDGELAPR
jgi:hypothetical protein